jgi:hypothetical protein
MKSCSAKKINKRLCLIITVVVVCILLATVGPYIFVVNSVPGQIVISDYDRQELLNDPVERVDEVCTKRQQRVLSVIANLKTDGRALNNRGGVVPLARIILANLSLGQNIEENNQLLKKLVIWGRSGSSWELHKTGDLAY